MFLLQRGAHFLVLQKPLFGAAAATALAHRAGSLAPAHNAGEGQRCRAGGRLGSFGFAFPNSQHAYLPRKIMARRVGVMLGGYVFTL